MDNLLLEARALLEGMWRRRWYALAVTWFVCVAGWISVATLPNQFKSEARIYVDTQTLLSPLLKGLAVRSNIEGEVAVMQRTMLTRPNLMQAARATDLDLQATTPEEVDNLLSGMARRTKVSADGSRLYRVSYVSSDPVLAKAMVQALLTIFVEGNLGQNRADMEGARAFIAQHILEYEGELKSAEARLASFKAKHSVILGGGRNFSQRVEAMRSQLEKKRLLMEEVISRRDKLQSQLASISETVTVQSQGRAAPKTPLKLRIEQLERLLDSQLLQYTEKHPNVTATKQTLETLRQQYGEEEARRGAAGLGASDGSSPQTSYVSNPVYQQVRIKLVETESNVASQRRRVDLVETQMSRMKELAKTAPLIEAELVDLTRDYGVLKRQYESLLARRESARISQAADSTTDAVNFRIIEPPHVPVLPNSPNRPLLMAVVLLAGIAAGLGLAILIDKMDGSFRTPESVADAFGLPVLGSVSAVVTSSQRRRRVGANSVLGMAYGSLLAVFILIMLFATGLVNLPEEIQADGQLATEARNILRDAPDLIKRLPEVLEKVRGMLGGG